MLIDNEQARIDSLPDSSLYAWLDQFYEDELEIRVTGNPHEVTAADLIAELESEQVDPLEHDWNGLEDSQLTHLWADLAYPLPHNADELAHEAYGTSPSDIARAALSEYAGMFNIEPVAERVLKGLQAQWNEGRSNV